MKIRHCSFLIIIISCLFLSCGTSLDKKIELSDDTLSGELANGLKYVIKKNTIPNKKIEFRLVMNVGSILEEDDERGSAHFIEHMAFNGTKNFPKDSIVQALRLMGIKYGFGLNAFTGYEKTVYVLPLPTDEEENINIGLRILKDWLTGINIDSESVEDEKGIILQEIKDAKNDDPFYSLKLKDSKYLDRLPLGRECDIKTRKSETLRKFYNKWYKPDLATIIAVGDIDPKMLEKKIKREFSKIINKGGIKGREYYSLKTAGEPDSKIIEDSLGNKNSIEIIFPIKDYPIVSNDDLKTEFEYKILEKVLSNRLKSIACSFYNSWYLSDIRHLSLVYKSETTNKSYELAEQIGSIFAELKKYSISDEEIEDAKSKIIEYLPISNDILPSDMLCANFLDYATTGDRHPSNKYRYEFYKKISDKINSEDIIKLLDVFISPESYKIICGKYNPKKNEEISANEVLLSYNNGLNTAPKRFVYERIEEEQEEGKKCKNIEVNDVVPGKILAKRYFENIGVTEVKFQNGLTLAIRPTESNSDEVSISLFSKGGLSVAEEGDIPLLNSTAAVIDFGGVGDLTVEDLNEISYQRELSISTFIGDYYHGLYGHCKKTDLEDLLKLLNLKILSPEKNIKEFNDYVKSLKNDLGNETSLMRRLQADPFRKLNERVADLTGNIFSCEREITSIEQIDKMNIDKIFKFYNLLYTQMSDMKLVITGDVNIDEVIRFTSKYIASVPGNKVKAKPKFLGRNYPKKKYSESIKSDEHQRTFCTYLYHGEYVHSLKESLIFKIMRDLIQNRLISKFREEMGMVYSPFVMANYRAYPDCSYNFQIDYSTDNKNVKLLEKQLGKEIQSFKEETIPEDELLKIVRSFIVTKRDVLTDDNYSQWRKKLQEIYLEENTISDFNDYDSIAKSISVEDIRQSFIKYFNLNNYITIYIK